jgi:hypothetical protein
MTKPYVYIHSPRLPDDYNPWLVGYYNPENELVFESRHPTQDRAASRVHYLNGGNSCAR